MARFFQKGVDAYKAQCAAGGKLIESAKEITDKPFYVYPATVSDVANYSIGGDDNLFFAALVVARAKTENNIPHFPTREAKLAALKELAELVPPKLINAVAMEILAAYGEDKTVDDALEADDPAVDVLNDEDITDHTPSAEGAMGNSEAA